MSNNSSSSSRDSNDSIFGDLSSDSDMENTNKKRQRPSQASSSSSPIPVVSPSNYICAIEGHGSYTMGNTVIHDVVELYNELLEEIQFENEIEDDDDLEIRKKRKKSMQPTISEQELIDNLDKIRLISQCNFGNLCIRDFKHKICDSVYASIIAYEHSFHYFFNRAKLSMSESIRLTRIVLRLVQIYYIYTFMGKPKKLNLNSLDNLPTVSENKPLMNLQRESMLMGASSIIRNWESIRPAIISLPLKLIYITSSFIDGNLFDFVTDVSINHSKYSQRSASGIHRIGKNTLTKRIVLNDQPTTLNHALYVYKIENNVRSRIVLNDRVNYNAKIKNANGDQQKIKDLENIHLTNPVAFIQNHRFKNLLHKIILRILNSNYTTTAYIYLFMILLNWDNRAEIPILDVSCSVAFGFDATQNIEKGHIRADSTPAGGKATKRRKRRLGRMSRKKK